MLSTATLQGQLRLNPGNLNASFADQSSGFKELRDSYFTLNDAYDPDYQERLTLLRKLLREEDVSREIMYQLRTEAIDIHVSKLRKPENFVKTTLAVARLKAIENAAEVYHGRSRQPQKAEQGKRAQNYDGKVGEGNAGPSRPDHDKGKTTATEDKERRHDTTTAAKLLMKESMPIKAENPVASNGAAPSAVLDALGKVEAWKVKNNSTAATPAVPDAASQSAIKSSTTDSKTPPEKRCLTPERVHRLQAEPEETRTATTITTQQPAAASKVVS